MTLSVLADVVLALHTAFVVFVVLGGLLVLRWPGVAWAHVPCAAWGAVVELAGWVCPLTPLEIWLRGQAGERAYEGSFLAHYFEPILYPSGLTREVQMWLGVGVIVLNAGIYWMVWRRRGGAGG